MAKQSSFKRRIVAFISSPKFFWGITVLLVLQAAWIACSGRYPMAFDEDFHLGIIRLYAHHLSPFWSGQPAGANTYGAVARDPSYLYHYLMSFPYRLISIFTHDQTIIVLILRAINIGLFASSLAIFRRVLLKTGASRTIVHGCLLVFVLVPVVPLLAAQINYDNLLMPLIGLVLLLTIQISDELGRQRGVNGLTVLQLSVLCVLGSLVKYAFLPVFAVIMLYLAIRLRQAFGGFRGCWKGLAAGIKQTRRGSRWLLIAVLVLSCGLFGERYGVNIVRYHTPIPDCGKVLSVQACSAYGPWIRDYNLSINKVAAAHNPAVFTADWFYGMWLRLFFAVDGPATNFETKGPFVVPGVSAVIFAGVSTVLILVYLRRIFRTYSAPVLSLLMSVTVVYIAALWLDEFGGYVRTGQPVAINGRYLLPVLLPMLLVSALAINELFKKRAELKLLVGGIAVVTMLYGGGALTYILRSRNAWYWPNSMVQTANRSVQNTLGPVTPGYRHPREFLH